jgi:quinone-modifying oxidoreductase subunit QmoC
MAEALKIRQNRDLIADLRKNGGENLKKCYQCATCSAVCSLSPQQSPFPRKEMLMAQWGMTDRLLVDPDLWLCYQCNDCSTHCPRGARPGDVLAAMRLYIYKKFSFPSFMGRALSSPRALPFLFLLPVLILLSCVLFTSPVDASGNYIFLTAEMIDFDLFLPHKTVDALFVLGMILIMTFALTGFVRFWKGLKSNGFETKVSFLPALIRTVVSIISHSDFYKCETNRSRAIGHILLFAGFVLSMIATGLVFVLIFIPHYMHEWQIMNISLMPWPPIELPNPIKIIGALGGIGLIVGALLLLVRRWSNSEDVGANGYADRLFLWIMFFVGLTGMLSWIMRSYVAIPMPAYVTYFIHMVFVYFLLWYMPYSKFSHMVYRTLALVYARTVGRTAAG